MIANATGQHAATTCHATRSRTRRRRFVRHGGEHGLDGLQALLPGSRLELVEVLGGSSRSRVRRVRADSRALIVKEFTGAGDGWVRESAALSVISSDVPIPRLVAVQEVSPTVVMSDVGRG